MVGKHQDCQCSGISAHVFYCEHFFEFKCAHTAKNIQKVHTVVYCYILSHPVYTILKIMSIIISESGCGCTNLPKLYSLLFLSNFGLSLVTLVLFLSELISFQNY